MVVVEGRRPIREKPPKYLHESIAYGYPDRVSE
jgi:hypothetical protein